MHGTKILLNYVLSTTSMPSFSFSHGKVLVNYLAHCSIWKLLHTPSLPCFQLCVLWGPLRDLYKTYGWLMKVDIGNIEFVNISTLVIICEMWLWDFISFINYTQHIFHEQLIMTSNNTWKLCTEHCSNKGQLFSMLQASWCESTWIYDL